MAAIDLYSGIGGWTLGFRMAGIQVISSNEWWRDANHTHNMNFGTDHEEINIRELQLEDLPNPDNIDYVIGSPPCTQFSFANKGGNGDIADGLIDIYKFLEIVEHMNPVYWAMENVPRVAKILKKEISEGGSLFRFRELFGDIRIYDSSEFGVPQKRKRMIAGRLPFNLLESYREVTPRKSLGDVLEALNNDIVIDPIYGKELNNQDVTDHIKEVPLSYEEARINKNSKTYHPIYNAMSFPDRWDRPSRTITALCTRVSRESIIIQDHESDLRRLTVRERGCIQSFPIDFHFYSNSYGGKLKMIGNAIPPILTFFIAQSMLEIESGNLIMPDQAENPLVIPAELPIYHSPDNRGAKYSWSRSFWMSIPNLRFGSGVRFELRNYHDKMNRNTSWHFNFFYGNSKNIKSKELDNNLFNRAAEIFNILIDNTLIELIDNYITYCNCIDFNGLQKNWTNQDREITGPIELIDRIGDFSSQFKSLLDVVNIESKEVIKHFVENELRNNEGKFDNKKLIENSIDVYIGILMGSIFNSVSQGNVVEFQAQLIH